MLHDQLAERFAEAGSRVRRVSPASLSQAVVGLIAEQGWHRLVSVRRNRVGHPSVLGDDPPLSDADLAGLDAVITEAALAVVEPPAVVLDHGPGQGRPELTRRARHHVCVVDQVVASEADARRLVGEGATWIRPSPTLTLVLVDTVAR